MNFKRLFQLILIFVVSLAMLTGCGSSGSEGEDNGSALLVDQEGSSSSGDSFISINEANNSTTTEVDETDLNVSKTKGYLIDSPLSGVTYECDGNVTLTDDNGTFECIAPPVTFRIGNLTLGTLNAFTDDGKVYPQDLVGVERANFSDNKLKLLTRLLQSLDDDGNIETQITITEDIRSKLTDEQNFADMSERDVEALLSELGKSLVNECGALEHLGDTSVSCESDGSYYVYTPSGSTPLTTSKPTITGYAEDDPMPNAKIKVTDEVNNLIVETTADANGKYTLQANFVNGKIYTLESKGKLGDRNVTLHSVFKFDKDTVVNANPITEIAYLLYKDIGGDLESINQKVLSYFGLTSFNEIEKVRFLTDSKAYKGMKKFTKSDIPIDAVEAFTLDLKEDLNNLRLLVLDDLKIIPSTESIEVGKSIVFSLNKEFTDDYNITWAGLDKGDELKLTSSYSGDRNVAVKVTQGEKIILTSSLTVNFYKTGDKKSISIIDRNLEQNNTIDGITITIPKESIPEGVAEISLENIDRGKDNVFKTFKMNPSGTIFNQPLIIRIPYDLSSVDDPSTLFIERLEEDGSVEILKPTVDYKKQELVFKTNHFSTFTIKTDKDGRKYVKDTWSDNIEDKLFVTDGKYKIKLDSLDDTNMYELIKEAVNGDYLTEDRKKIVEEFYDEGYDWEWDGFDDNYEKAFRYVLAEPFKTENLTEGINKYELIVDSLKKYRIAKLVDAYVKNDMLVKPYDHWGIGSTTRSDFFNEILNVEKESYGLIENKAFHINSNATLDAIMSFKNNVKTLSDTAQSILDNGFLKTGTTAGWSILKTYIADEVKHEIGKHFTNESLTHLQCFNYVEDDGYGEYKIGDTSIFTLYDDGTITNNKLEYFYAIVEELERNAGDFYSGFDLNLEQKKFAECIYNKIHVIEEDKTLTGDLMNGGKALASKNLRHELWKVTNEFYNLVSDESLGKYDSILKILNFNKEQLKEYSKYLKTLAIANMSMVISDIVVEAKLIDGDSIEDIKDDGFFIDDTAKKKALIKFKTYYKERSLRSLKEESSDKIDVYSLDKFKNLKLQIDKKYIDKFSLDVVNLDIDYVNLEKKVSSDDIVGNYYETIGSFKLLSLKNNDIKLDDYTFNSTTNKYQISLDTLFQDMDISEIAYLDAKLSIRFTYNNKPYYIEKPFSFIADSNPDELIVKEVEEGAFTVLVKDDSSNPLDKVNVIIGDKNCDTNISGKCTIQGLIPSEYKISVLKDGYLPEYKDSFIDVASKKEIEFTLKEYDTSADIVLDVSAVRSEVNPMEYKFYINALGDNLDLNISFGDGENIEGKLNYLLGKENFITHLYSVKGMKTASIKISDSKDNTLQKTLDVYPIDSDKIIDVVFLVDLSGSYGDSLSNFQSQAIQIANGFATLGSDTRVGLASFDEFPSYADSDDFAYALNKELTYDFDSFNYAVNQMVLKWGGDGPESQLEGLYQVAKTFNWQDKSEKYIFLATDASFHNSDIEKDYPGPGYTKTLKALRDKNIKVIGLNRGGADIDDVTKVTNDTGGTIFYLDSSSSDIVDKIMDFSETSKTSRSIIRKVFRKRMLGSTIQGNAN